MAGLFQQKQLKADDLKPKLSKAVNRLKTSKSYLTADSIEALKTIRDASKHQNLQLALGDHLTEAGYVTLLVNIYKSLKKAGTDKAKSDSKTMEHVASNITSILTTLAQFTAESARLCTALKNENILPFFIDELRKISKPFDELEKNVQREVPLILEILYHCIRHCGELRSLYRKHDLVPLLTKLLNTEEVMVKTTSLVILAHVVDETESDKLATTGSDGVVNFLIFRQKAALHSRLHRAGGFSAEGLLQGMIHLMASDANKVKVMQQGALPLILRMLKRAEKRPFSEEEQILAATAIWKLAFIESNRKILKADRDVIDALNDFKNSKNPKLRDACCGALWEIYEGQIEVEEEAANGNISNASWGARRSAPADLDSDDEDQEKESKAKKKHRSLGVPGGVPGLRGRRIAKAAPLSQEEKQPESHIMISYQWASQKLMIQVKNALQKAGYNVWMDVEKMEGNILAAMANAVEKAGVVLIAMSSKYKESNNCRTEASYAYKLKKPIIPLLVEDDFDPDGWLGALVGMLLYYKIINKDTLSKQLPLVMKEIGNSGRIGSTDAKQAHQSATTKTTATESDTNPSEPQTHKTKVQLSDESAVSSSYSEWTTAQVQQWLSDNKLAELKIPLKDYDGKCLVHMGKLCHRCPEFFHTSLKAEYKLDLLSVIKFSAALENLSQE